jgi:hypothetical protein
MGDGVVVRVGTGSRVGCAVGVQDAVAEQVGTGVTVWVRIGTREAVRAGVLVREGTLVGSGAGFFPGEG